MLKKLVIVGSLLAVGPLLAGCPGAVVIGVQAIPLVLEAADATGEGIASVAKRQKFNSYKKSSGNRYAQMPTSEICESLKKFSYNK